MKNKSIDMAVCHVELNHIERGLSRALKATLAIFREVCKFIGGVIEENWDEISALSGSEERLTFVENLIHKTKGNVPKYPEFDVKFYKFPSYYRRSAINYCIGQASSYYTRLAEYQERRKAAIDNGKRFKENPPVLNWDTNACPSMYKKEMYYVDGKTIYIKVFIRNTWDWVEVSAPARDLKDLAEKSAMGTLKSPMLTYKYHKFYLIFPIKYHVAKFPNTKLSERRMMGIDLGVNRGATLNIMDSSGTILARFFDPFTRERDQMDHLINKIRKIQRQSGNGNSIAAIYTKLDGIKNNYVSSYPAGL